MPERTIALCGAGMISAAHAAAASVAGLPVVAVASRDPRRAVERTATTGGQAVLFEELPAGADIVVVCTPPGAHAEAALRALEAGAAVVVEKPLCTTLDDADRLVDAARRHGQRLLYAENLAYAPVVLAFLERVPALGVLTHLEARAVQSLPTWGGFTTREWGGGALFDLGAHPLALAMMVARASGAGEPVAVSAELRGGQDHATDEHAEVRLRFAGGLTAHVVSSWAGGDVPHWDLQASSGTGVLRAELHPEPSLEGNGDPLPVPPWRARLGALDWAGYIGQLTAFAQDLATGTAPAMDAEWGRAVLEVTCAAYASAGRGGAEETLPFSGPRDRTPLELWRSH